MKEKKALRHLSRDCVFVRSQQCVHGGIANSPRIFTITAKGVIKMKKFRTTIQSSTFAIALLSCLTYQNASAQPNGSTASASEEVRSETNEDLAPLFRQVEQMRSIGESIERRMKPIIDQTTELHLETIFNPVVITSQVRIESARLKVAAFRKLLSQRRALVAEGEQAFLPFKQLLTKPGQKEPNEKFNQAFLAGNELVNIEFELADVADAFLRFGEIHRGQFALVSGQMLFESQDLIDNYQSFFHKFMALAEREAAVVERIRAFKKSGSAVTAKYNAWKESKTKLIPRLLGKWKFESADGCRETYEFRPDGSFESHSGEEVIAGSFVATTIHPVARADLILKRSDKKSNRRSDCTGTVLELSNTSDERYIAFDPIKDEFLVCDSEEASYCMGPVKRLGDEHSTSAP
jgi:hypothetical protein